MGTPNRLRAEIHGLARTFYPHRQNSHTRKFATMAVVAVWVAIEVGHAYGYATLPAYFDYLRLFIGVLVGRMWGIEVDTLLGLNVPASAPARTDGSGERDDDDGGE